MAKTLKEKNQMECNKRARKKYIKENYKVQTIRIRNNEYEMIDNYCKSRNIPKNSFFINAVLKEMSNESQNNNE